MLVNQAVLGILSLMSMTGYDIKKIISSSPFMHWSGNNNQIYKALTELKDDGLVESSIIYGQDTPTKKEYSITEQGKAELLRMSHLPPEAPHTKKTFLVQLAWADKLSRDELLDIIASYEREVFGVYKKARGQAENCILHERLDERQKKLWKLIYENAEAEYNAELDWVERLRDMAKDLEWNENKNITKESFKTTMKHETITKNNKKYVKLLSSGRLISDESDATDIISLCAESDTNLVMIPSECLSEDFFRLSTRLAGHFLQRLTNYMIKCVVIMDTDSARGKLKEFINETNRGSMFRAYTDIDQAEEWILE